MKTVESVKGGELLIETIDVIETEMSEILEWQQLHPANKSIDKTSGTSETFSKSRKANPRLLGLTPFQYALKMLKTIKPPDLEQALLILPFHYVSRFISLLLKVTSSISASVRLDSMASCS